jgi:hypothetical protein
MREAMRDYPEVARRLANAVAADVEDDTGAVLDFAYWVAGCDRRVRGLVLLACTGFALAGLGADDLRTIAAMQGHVQHRRPR